MLRSILYGQDIRMILISLLLSLPIVLISLTVHEFSHGYIAYKLGDKTAKNLGRLSLNPLKHLDPIGALCMLLTGFGWAKPVPISARNFKKPRRDMALTAIAGPISNILLSFIGLVILVLYMKFAPAPAHNGSFAYYFDIAVQTFLYNFHMLNLILAIFNLIPVPPLDGSRFFYVLLPDKWYFGVMKYEKAIQIIIFVALFTGILSVPLDIATDFLSNCMFKLINLII